MARSGRPTPGRDPAAPCPALCGRLPGGDAADAPAPGPHAAPSDRQTPPRADPLSNAWFDAFTLVERDPRHANLWIRGGPRLRLAADRPAQAPALNKVPLIRWRAGDAFAGGAHAALPRGLNRGYARDGGEALSAAILHTKLLDGDPARAAQPARAAEHYAGGREHLAWAEAARSGDGFHGPWSLPWTGWRGLERAGLLGRGLWA